MRRNSVCARKRNAFVSVRREELVKAINALTGAMIAGKVAAAEPARERAGEGDADGGAAQGDHSDEAPAAAPRPDVHEAPTQEMTTVRRHTLEAPPAARPSVRPATTRRLPGRRTGDRHGQVGRLASLGGA